MALTSWNDILNKPKAVADVEELALTVEQLSASVLSISEDVGELELSVSDLSASVLSISEDVGELALDVSQLSASVLSISTYVENLKTYSTTEEEVGEWTDGSIIYKKTFILDMPDSTTTATAHNISNLSRIVSVKGIMNRPVDNNTFILPFCNLPASLNAFVMLDATNISLNSNFDSSAYKAFITVYYTKST